MRASIQAGAGILVSSIAERLRDPFFSLHVMISLSRNMSRVETIRFKAAMRKSEIIRPLFKRVIYVAALLIAANSVWGQQPVASPQPLPAPTAVPQVSQSIGGASAAIQEYSTAIHGIQGVLAETIDGRVLASQAPDETFNPASSVKLATALAALQSLGPNYRYVTALWTTGTLDQATGTLNGDLILSGRDPSFHYEHAVMLARELNNLGIRTVSGNLIVAPTFTMNFDWSASRAGRQLYETLDASQRSTAASLAWSEERTRAGDTASLNTVSSVTINGSLELAPAPPGATPLFTHRSSRLVDILKVLLCYSNNFMAERIGDTLGGPSGVRQLVISRLKLNPEDFRISSLSGLGVNRVTPRAMMTILRALRTELARHKLAPSDILPVAGIDPGTLEDRYTSPQQRGSVIAKTGTLISTDRGASSLVGQTKTRSGTVVLFVIFNQQGSVSRFRANQDEIVTSIQTALGGPAAFPYRPIALAMRLTDTENEASKSKSEYEPKDK